MSAEKRRELVRDIREQYDLSERHTCRIISISRTVLRYQPKLRCDDEIINALKTISEAHPRWGFGKLYHCAIKDMVGIISVCIGFTVL